MTPPLGMCGPKSPTFFGTPGAVVSFRAGEEHAALLA